MSEETTTSDETKPAFTYGAIKRHTVLTEFVSVLKDIASELRQINRTLTEIKQRLR